MVPKLIEDPKFTEGTDANIISFISALLAKEPQKRAKFEDIKNHPFFNGLNFQDVLDKKFKPIYVPQDTSNVANNFDAEFTNEKPMDSDGEETEPATKDDFTGFSYFGGLNQPPPDEVASDDDDDGISIDE